MRTVVIIDPDVEYSAKLADAVNGHPNFKVAAKAIGSKDGNVLIKHREPDVIIMDVILSGDDDGLGIIKDVHKHYKDYRPYLFVITAVNTLSMEEMLVELEVDFIEYKPIEATTLNNVLDKISLDKVKTKENYASHKWKKIIADVVEDTLLEIGVEPKYLGFSYAKIALCKMLETPILYCDVYKTVCAESGATRSSVDRNLRSVAAACVGSDLNTKLFAKKFGKYPASNLDFIHGLATYIEKIVRWV